MASLDPLDEPPPVGANIGAGEKPPPARLPPDDELPPLDELPDPLIGPVAYCPCLVPPGGIGTLKGDDGLLVTFGVIGGFIDGRAVGGCGLACCVVTGAFVCCAGAFVACF